MHTQTSIATSIIESLYLKNRNFCSDDYDDCLSYLMNYLPFKVHSYSSPFNQWQIPPRWNLKRALIKNVNGKLLYEVDHPLKIIGLSTSYCGKVKREKLLKHLHYDHRYPEAIPYHFRQFYRPWERTWGFCVPKTFYDSLNEDEYFVEILTEESKGELKVVEYTKKGELPYSFYFVAHLDHPGMVNDDLAGVAVGVELFKALEKLETKFSYTLLLVPEIIGSEFYLGHTQNRDLILEGCFLEMLGSNTKLALQKSLHENSQIEKKLKEVLLTNKTFHKTGPFKSIICNDEMIFEGYQIPMCSLSRFPYKEYHTHFDNLNILSQKSLSESFDILYNTILELEKLTLIEKKFNGTPCLSHPSYDLYIDPGQRAFGTHKENELQSMRLLMDLIPAQKKFFFLEELTSKLDLSKEKVFDYISLWETKNLLKVF